MLTYDKLMGWRPAGLTATADQLNTDRKKFIDLQDEISQGKPPSSWIGAAADSANAAYPKVRDNLNDVVAEISPVIQALDDAATSIKAAQEAARTAMTTIESRGWVVKVSAAGVQVSDPTPRDDLSQDQKDGLVKLMQEVAADLQDALDKAEQADADLAYVLGQVTTGTYDGGTGSIEQASLPPDLRNLSGKALIDRLLSDPAKYGGYVDALPVSDQKALGDAIADEAGPIAGGNSGSPYDTRPMSQDDLDKLNAAVNAYGGDPTVATQVANDVGTDGLMNIQQGVDALYTTDGAYDPDSVGASQRGWGNLLAAATRGIGSDDAVGTNEHVSAHWAEQLTSRGADIYNTGESEQMYGYKLLGPLLRDDSHGSWFLNHVGDHMEKFEHDYMASHDGESPWDRAEVPRQIDFTHGAAEIGLTSGDPTRDSVHAINSEPTGADPFGGLFEGLSHNPDAAREFLSGDGPYDESRVHHYMADRDWPHHGAVSSDWPTSERYFGDALVAATTEDVHGPEAGHLATEAFGAASDVIHDTGSGDDLQHHGLPDEMRRAMARVANGYMPDVYHALSDGDVDTAWGPYAHRPAMADLADEHHTGVAGTAAVREVMGDIGRDRDAYDIAQSGAHAYLGVGLDHELGRNDVPLTEDGRLGLVKTNVINPYGNVSGALQAGWDDDRIAEAKAYDQAYNSAGDGKYHAGAWILKQAIGEGTGHIPIVGGAIGDLADSGIDAGADHLADRNNIDSTGLADDEMSSRAGSSHDALEAQIDAAYYRHIPVHDLPPELRDGGARVPMEHWTNAQVRAWEHYRSEDPVGNHSASLLNAAIAAETDGRQKERGQ